MPPGDRSPFELKLDTMVDPVDPKILYGNARTFIDTFDKEWQQPPFGQFKTENDLARHRETLHREAVERLASDAHLTREVYTEVWKDFLMYALSMGIPLEILEKPRQWKNTTPAHPSKPPYPHTYVYEVAKDALLKLTGHSSETAVYESIARPLYMEALERARFNPTNDNRRES